MGAASGASFPHYSGRYRSDTVCVSRGDARLIQTGELDSRPEGERPIHWAYRNQQPSIMPICRCFPLRLRQFAGIPIVLLLAACSQLPVKNTAAAADAEKLNAARRAAIQGDMVSALQGLRELSPNFLSAKDAAMRECMLQRHAASA